MNLAQAKWHNCFVYTKFRAARASVLKSGEKKKEKQHLFVGRGEP